MKTKDFTYNNLKGIINNKYLVVLKRDKDSSEGIIDKSDYASKVHKMIDESINNGIEAPTIDNTLKYLNLFQSFLYRTFRNYEWFEMGLKSSGFKSL